MAELPRTEGIVAIMALRRRVPCVVDTNVLAFDVIQCAKRGRRTALVDAALSGSGPVFAPTHVHAETRDLLEERAHQKGVDPSVLYAIWDQLYRPLVRFVDVPPADDQRVATVAALDQDDEPTARLAVLIAPSYLLSKDRVLIDAGLATPEALAVALALRLTGLVDTAIFGGAGAATLTGVGAAGGVRLALRHPRITAVGLAVIAVALLRWREELRRELPGVVADIRNAGGQVLEAMGQLVMEEARATAAVEAKLIPASSHTTLARILAEMARQRWPVPAATVAESTGVPASRVREVFRSYPAFEHQNGRWVLGRVGAEFS